MNRINKNQDKNSNKNVGSNNEGLDFFIVDNAGKYITEALDKAEKHMNFDVPDMEYFEALIEKTMYKKASGTSLNQKATGPARKLYFRILKDNIAFGAIALSLLLIQLFVVFNFTNFFVYFQIACIIIPVAAIPKIIKKRMGSA